MTVGENVKVALTVTSDNNATFKLLILVSKLLGHTFHSDGIGYGNISTKYGYEYWVHDDGVIEVKMYDTAATDR
jgi:hypothetical protein